jgi:NhaP-type Na+/H+ or K+/H+ antiporter
MKNYVSWAFILGIFFGLVVGWSIGTMRAHVEIRDVPVIVEEVPHNLGMAINRMVQQDFLNMLYWREK